ncbi:MAG: radical SAM protein [Thermotogota bacterium]|nr:radical SAM protein [Thermotogota bacterium]
MNVKLIKAPCSSSETIYDKWMMPLELCSIATMLKDRFSDLGIEIIDGQFHGRDKILNCIRSDADVVGITYTIYSTETMENIARIAKSNGAFVVIGGPAATATAFQVLENKNIDAVVLYDGEFPMVQLVSALKRSPQNPDLCNIPNLLCRENRISGPLLAQKPCLDEYPPVERNIGGLNINSYINAYPMTCTEKRLIAKRPTNAYSKKGCPRSCSFCGRVDKGFRMRSPLLFYEEIKNLSQQYDVDYIYDHSDTWINNNWIDEYVSVLDRKGYLDLRYMIFADVRDITKHNSQILKNIGVDIVLLGIESGCDSLLAKNRKNITRESILESCDLLLSNDMKISASFVLGLIGETDESLNKTVKLIKQLKTMGDVTIYCNTIIPLPGSYIWKKMMEIPMLHTMYGDKYKFNVDQLRNMYIKFFTDISGGLQQLNELRDSILEEEEILKIEYAR